MRIPLKTELKLAVAFTLSGACASGIFLVTQAPEARGQIVQKIDQKCADLRAWKLDPKDIKTTGDINAAGFARAAVATGKVYCAVFDMTRREWQHTNSPLPPQ